MGSWGINLSDASIRLAYGEETFMKKPLKCGQKFRITQKQQQKKLEELMKQSTVVGVVAA